MPYTIQEVGARARSKNPDLFTNFTDEQIGQRLVDNNPSIKALVQPATPKQSGSNLSNLAEGIGKGEFKTFGNLMNAVQTGFNAPLKATNWVSNQLGGKDVFNEQLMEQGKNAIPQELRTASNPAQQAGMTIENIAEYFLPGTASWKAGSAVKAGLNAPKIIKSLAGLGTTMGLEGVLGTGQSALQSGKLGKEEVKTGLYSLAAPAVMAGGAKVLGATAKSVKPIKDLTQKIGTYAKGRLPKALGIFSGENNDVIEEALKNPKLANLGIDGGDIALRKAVDEGASNSIKIKNAFVQGYTQAKDKVMGEYTKTLIPKPNIVGTFNKLLKENNVVIGKDGTLDFTKSLIKANPGEVTKIDDAYNALKAWDKFDINSLDDYKQLVGKLTHFATEAGVPSKSPFLGKLYNNLNNIAYSRLPKEIAAKYKVLNTNFSKNIGTYDDIVDAFNSGDPFTKLANALGKNKDSLRQIINFYEKQSGTDILPIVAGRELGMEKQAAFGFLNPRSWIDFIISPQLQGKIITGIGSKLPKAKLPVPALKSTIEGIEGGGKAIQSKLPSVNKETINKINQSVKLSPVQNITKNVGEQLEDAVKESQKLLKIAQKSGDIKDWVKFTENQHFISTLQVEVAKLAKKVGNNTAGSAEDVIQSILPKGKGVATPKTALGDLEQEARKYKTVSESKFGVRYGEEVKDKAIQLGKEGSISKKALFAGAGALTGATALSKFSIKPKAKKPIFTESKVETKKEANPMIATYYNPTDPNQTKSGGSGVGALNRPVEFGDIAVGNRELLAKAKEAQKNGKDILVYIPELKSWKTPYGMGIFRINDTMNIRFANMNPPKIDIAIPSDRPDAEKLQSAIGKKQMTYEILD